MSFFFFVPNPRTAFFFFSLFMSHYFQLLGSDTPNGYGGCCYHGPLDHPVFQDSPAISSLTSAAVVGKSGSGSNGDGTLQLMAWTSRAAHTDELAASPASGCSCDSASAKSGLTDPTADVARTQVEQDIEGRSSTATAAAASSPSEPGWNRSSYLAAPRPAWPAGGLLHLASLLGPPPPPDNTSRARDVTARSGAAAAAAAACVAAPGPLHASADTGSSGNEGYIFFNCPEGTQRFSSEANIKLKKVRCFCFTRWSCSSDSNRHLNNMNSVDRDGGGYTATTTPADDQSSEPSTFRQVGAASAAMGLPGMLFTINDAGSRQATFFGPSVGPGTLHTFRSSTMNTPDSVHRRACESKSSEGLRGLLTALRFHYFQHRPMVFRQLHGVMACTSAAWTAERPMTARETKAEAAATAAATLGSELHFVEIVGDDCDARGGSSCGGEKPSVATSTAAKTTGGNTSAGSFFYATVPLSSQSVLVAFRVSGGAAVRTTAGAKTSGEAAMPLFAAHGGAASCGSAHGDSAQTSESNGEGTEPKDCHTPLYALPDSSDVVLGYAVVVAPGSTFDAAKARALGVRSGPKYGLLKQGIAVEADLDGSEVGASAQACKAAKKKAVKRETQATSVNTELAADDNNSSNRSTIALVPAATTNAKTTAATTTTAAPGDTTSPGMRASARWVHPYQVLRPTQATKHAYISLVLDGDAPQDVRRAVSELFIGQRQRHRHTSSKAAAEEEEKNAGEEEGGGGGALVRLLRSHFPHLAYYLSDEVEGGATAGAAHGTHDNGGGHVEDECTRQSEAKLPKHQQQQQQHGGGAFTRRPRQLTVRHVVHVQPASYFESFDRSRLHLHAAQGQADDATMSSADDMYTDYNAYVFGDVIARSTSAGYSARSRHTDAVQISLEPSLSFTLSDLAEVQHDSYDANTERGTGATGDVGLTPRPAVGTASPVVMVNEVPRRPCKPRHTWHLFTSYVQSHFTAFPTALVHRYHLHHLAPALFPLHGVNEAALVGHAQADDGDDGVPFSAAPGLKSHFAVQAQEEEEERTTEYWPYSLKLRCVPETALQLHRRNTQACAPSAPTRDFAATRLSHPLLPRHPPPVADSHRSRCEAASPPPAAAAVTAAVMDVVRGGWSKPTPDTTATPAPPLKREKRELTEMHTAALRSEGAPAIPAAKPNSDAERPTAGAPHATKTSTSKTPVKQENVNQGGRAEPTASAAARAAPRAPRDLAVVDGQASLLPYPTPASAIALLSSSFLSSLQSSPSSSTRLVEKYSTAATENRTVKSPLLSESQTYAPRIDELSRENRSSRISRISSGCEGGALGFLGTGSAVPSKYRNVSGTYLELFLPRYCFGEVVVEAAAPASDPTKTGAPVQQRPARRSASDSAAPLTSAVSFASSSSCASLPRDASELRRGVVILDFGEGSLGQLASLCEGVREGVRGAGRRAVRSSEATTESRGGEKGPASRAESSDAVVAVAAAPNHTGDVPHCPRASQSEKRCQCGNKADQLREFVLDIVLIFISHAHADHHLGLLSLLTLRHHYLSAYPHAAATTSSTSKLLIVCPTEVHEFLMDAWGNTAPYQGWLHEECVFELMPPPMRWVASSTATSAAAAAAAGKGEAKIHLEVGRARVIDSEEHNLDDLPQHGDDRLAEDHACYPCTHARHSSETPMSMPMQPPQHVVPVPLLQAQLRWWNRCIAQHTNAQEQQPQPRLSQAEEAVEADTTGGRETEKQGGVPRGDSTQEDTLWTEDQPASLPSDLWWDAEVITVDHPANAHALLLRFPSCPAHRARGSAAATVQITLPLAKQPDTSRVFLFSGDTRPSPFLVERSRAFSCRGKTSAADANTDAVSAPVFILLHEATFGPGFEAEAVRKKHSTLPEALSIGAAVAAEFIVLNHFSQRYPKLPGLSTEQLGGKSTELVCQRRPKSTTTQASPVVTTTSTASLHADHADVAKEMVDKASTNEEEAADKKGVAASGARPLAAHVVVSDEGAEGVSEAVNRCRGVDATPSTPSAPSLGTNVSFAFDLMSVSFAAMHRGLVPRLTPALVRLLEEYDSWGVSTTHRMRTARGGDGGSSSSSNQDKSKEQQE